MTIVAKPSGAGFAERAEDATADVRRPASALELRTDEYVLWSFPNQNPIMGQANRLRFGTSRVERSLAEVRRWFGGVGRNRFSWAVGRHATPADLATRLERTGARPADDSPLAVMVLVEEPPGVAGVEARPVATFEEFRTQLEIRFEAFAFSESDRRAIRARGEKPWRDFLATGNSIHVRASDRHRPTH